MGCVSSTFLDDEARIVRPSALGHHIVSLTSTTYGILATLDQPPPQNSSSIQQQPAEIINTCELMAGLDHPSKSFEKGYMGCPPGGEDALVLYTTTLGGIRKTFEDCNAVRSLIESLGVVIKERDIWMDRGFREELKKLMKEATTTTTTTNVPQVFVKGRYIGGAESVMRMHEEGKLLGLLEGLPKAEVGCTVCDGCGGSKFLPCFRCSGSRKVVVSGGGDGGGVKGGGGGGGGEKGMVVRCIECNENGLVLCPICC